MTESFTENSRYSPTNQWCILQVTQVGHFGNWPYTFRPHSICAMAFSTAVQKTLSKGSDITAQVMLEQCMLWPYMAPRTNIHAAVPCCCHPVYTVHYAHDL